MKTKIVLYGTGMIAEKFYWKFHDEYEIEYCIDRRQRKPFHGLRVFNPDEKAAELKNKKVIVAVAGDEQYNAIRKTLTGYGLREFDDFLWSYELGKKLVILYGNCHLGVLHEYFMRTPSFAHEYSIRLKCVYDKRGDNYFQVPSEEELKHCSLLILQDIREENSQHVPSANKIKEQASASCRVLTIPNLYGYNLFFPQLFESVPAISGIARERHINELAKDNEAQPAIANYAWEIGFMINGDYNIAQIYNNNLTIDDMVARMEAPDFYAHEAIKKNFDSQIVKIQEREALCDIGISDYLLKTYQDRQAFYDPQHPCEHIICEKGRRILSELGIFAPPQETSSVIVSPRLNDTELFIYESVRQALGLSYRQDYIRINADHATLQHGCLSREEYIKDVLQWTYGSERRDSFEERI